MAYLDTSILGSYYCPEALSPAVTATLHSLGNPCVSGLCEVEFMSLLSFKVRTHHLTPRDAEAIRRLFLGHRSRRLFRMLSLTDHHYTQAATWLGRLNTPLRALDALHLAVASDHKQELWTTDKPLAASARVLGIRCKLITL